MRTPSENKSLTTFDVACLKCGGPARPERTGTFCPSCFFIEDPATHIHTSPDPISDALRADPDRLAAEAKMQAAEADYNTAADEWNRVLSELHAVRIKARHDEGTFDGGLGWRPSRTVAKLRKREAELVDELETVTRRKTYTETELRIARSAYRETAAAASRRLGRSCFTSNVRGGERTVYIPQT